MTYLTREELAALLGCAPTSYATMARRLRAAGIPHIVMPGACPRVARSVHDALLRGERVASASAARPNFEALA